MFISPTWPMFNCMLQVSLHHLQISYKILSAKRSIAGRQFLKFPPEKKSPDTDSKVICLRSQELEQPYYLIRTQLYPLSSVGDESPGLLASISNNVHRRTARNLRHLAAAATAYCAQSTFHAEAPEEVFLTRNFDSNWKGH